MQGVVSGDLFYLMHWLEPLPHTFSKFLIDNVELIHVS
jgi:hypothetical protein